MAPRHGTSGLRCKGKPAAAAAAAEEGSKSTDLSLSRYKEGNGSGRDVGFTRFT